jgi:hypothetical protein
MKLSEKIMWNLADAYILQCALFPLDQIERFDTIYQQMEGSIYIHICSLSEPILLEQADYSDLILPKAKLEELQTQIEAVFTEVSLHAKSTFWTILVQYLWKHADRVLSDIKYERRFKDPELGEFFRLLEEAKKNGLFGGSGLLE